MAKQQRTVDVWILENNTIYRDVPFTVVTDWIQEGRLLPADKVRAAGSENWMVLGKVPAFQAYLPQPEPAHAEDQAEALEPVETELKWKRGRGDEEEDVDMIPLIDISLVLLIFFMMTMAVSTGILAPLNTPEATYKLLTIDDDMYWVGIDIKDNLGNIRQDDLGQPIPWYSVGKGEKTFKLAGGKAKSMGPILKELEEKLADYRGPARVRIRADQTLPLETIDDVMIDLQKMTARINQRRPNPSSKITLTFAGEVSEPKGKKK